MYFIDLDTAGRLATAHTLRRINYVQALAELESESRIDVKPVAGGHAIYAENIMPLNRAEGLGLGDDVSNQDMDYLELFYTERRVDPRVDLVPLARQSFIDLLCQRGYKLERFYSVLVRPLLDFCASLSVSRSLSVRRASHEESQTWIRTVTQGLTDEEEPKHQDMRKYAPTFFSADTTCFLAWLGEKPAGGSALVVNNRVAEIASAATRIPLRRQGVQRALIGSLLEAARNEGCDVAMSVTTPGGPFQHLLEDIGFQMAYSTAIMVFAGQGAKGIPIATAG